jgi:hypothetical protein
MKTTESLDLNGKLEGGTVECLGQTFPNDQARREHFLKLLAEKLKDPGFREQDGFPKGSDEAILAMSDPPYYTACPNPWFERFVEVHGRSYDPDECYGREPFAADVSGVEMTPYATLTAITQKSRRRQSLGTSSTTQTPVI